MLSYKLFQNMEMINFCRPHFDKAVYQFREKGSMDIAYQLKKFYYFMTFMSDTMNGADEYIQHGAPSHSATTQPQ